MIEDIQQYWQRFLEYEYANELMMGIGVLLFIIAALKIIRSSLKLLFWVFLGTLGATAFSYGYNSGDIFLPGDVGSASRFDLSALIRDGKEDALRLLCERLPGYQDVEPVNIE